MKKGNRVESFVKFIRGDLGRLYPESVAASNGILKGVVLRPQSNVLLRSIFALKTENLPHPSPVIRRQIENLEWGVHCSRMKANHIACLFI